MNLLICTFAVLLPHIVQYACDPIICDEATKLVVKDFVQKLIDSYPKLYINFLAKYDCHNQYAAKLENVLNVKRKVNKNHADAYQPDFDQYDDNYDNI